MAAAAESNFNVEGLRDVFRCFICMEKLQDARLCPHCSKFCCYPCIRRWIIEQRAQCPHCRSTLRVSDLVKCRWADEVTQRLDRLEQPTSQATSPRSDSADKCPTHDEKLSVFCATCDSCICHHCALWGGTHSGHTLKPLEEEYGGRVTQVAHEVRQLRRRLCQLINTLQQLECNMESVRTAKDERAREARAVVEAIVGRLDAQMKAKLASLMSQKRSLSLEVEMVESVLSEVEHQLATASQSHLVACSAELFRMLGQIRRSPPAPPLLVAADFASEVVPTYDAQTFVLRPFSRLRAAADPVYSPPLEVNGICWRLKVYPDGNGVVRGNYMSVFLELSQGPVEQAKYEYRVELCHSSGDTNRNIVREFSSEFEVGECWGYNRFFKVEYLSTEGFLNVDDDSLVLHFYVRPPSYYQKCKDLTWHIEQVEANHFEQLAKMRSMTEKLTLALASGSSVSNIEDPLAVRDFTELADIHVDLPELETAIVSEATDHVAVAEARPTTPSRHNSTAVVEKDVDDELQSTDNDVDEELAALGGLSIQLDRLSLSLPVRVDDRSPPSLRANPPRRCRAQPPTQTLPEGRASRQASASFTVSRIQQAFRSDPCIEMSRSLDAEDECELRVRSADGDETDRLSDCPSTSPRSRRRSLYRRARGQHDALLGEAASARAAARAERDASPPEVDDSIAQLESIRRLLQETLSSSSVHLSILLEAFTNAGDLVANGRHCDPFWFTGIDKCDMQMSVCIEPAGFETPGLLLCGSGWIELGRVTTNADSVRFHADADYGGWHNPMTLTLPAGWMGFQAKVHVVDIDPGGSQLIDRFVHVFANGSLTSSIVTFSHNRPAATPTSITLAYLVTDVHTTTTNARTTGVNTQTTDTLPPESTTIHTESTDSMTTTDTSTTAATATTSTTTMLTTPPPCHGHGLPSVPSGRCECFPNWTGATCSVPLCLNGGTALGNGSCVCPARYSGVFCQVAPRAHCADLFDQGVRLDGVRRLLIDGVEIDVYCDMATGGGGWTIIQSRSADGEQFGRTFDEYRSPFGVANGSFWLGNDNIHWLTTALGQAMELRVELSDCQQSAAAETYSRFIVAGAGDNYRLSVSVTGNTGAARDGFNRRAFGLIDNLQQFSTPDAWHSVFPQSACLAASTGGWWFGSCSNNLNGAYSNRCFSSARAGVRWDAWYPTQTFSAATSAMKIRPTDFQPRH